MAIDRLDYGGIQSVGASETVRRFRHRVVRGSETHDGQQAVAQRHRIREADRASGGRAAIVRDARLRKRLRASCATRHTDSNRKNQSFHNSPPDLVEAGMVSSRTDWVGRCDSPQTQCIWRAKGGARLFLPLNLWMTAEQRKAGIDAVIQPGNSFPCRDQKGLRLQIKSRSPRRGGRPSTIARTLRRRSFEP